MPKLTFYNLPDEKKRVLIRAIKSEFSRVPLFEASISNIVKAAGIPRGSFYQYFDDKDDAFFFLLDELAEKEKYNFLSILNECEGDLFETAIAFYERMLEEEEHFHFLKNAFLNMTQKIESSFTRTINDNNKNSENFKATAALIDKSNLNISSEKELFHVLQIITTITFRNLVETFAHNLSHQESLDNLKMEMTLIKKGVVRESAFN
ncbi:MAG TPA: TetR/AcrR family transcriptional regulator [Bacillus bacterium]|nr:TetR/AcrR family transcriptional regulator [Siminovitchia fordii]HBZ11635.1 TetR/AcrR family transcriptional regulator [Bacillus sp. (in: firmicutes)]